MKPLRVQDVLKLLRREIDRAGGQSEWARQTGVYRTHLNKVLNGWRPPGPSICRALGLKSINAEEVLLILRQEIEKAGSTNSWCRQVGLNRAYVGRVLRKRKGVGRKILAALKLLNVLLDIDDTRAARRLIKSEA
jgi:DNA-binding phage protein